MNIPVIVILGSVLITIGLCTGLTILDDRAQTIKKNEKEETIAKKYIKAHIALLEEAKTLPEDIANYEAKLRLLQTAMEEELK